MIVNGYKITPAPVEYLPFRAYVEYEEGATARYLFLDEDQARLSDDEAGMLGEAACAYLAWRDGVASDNSDTAMLTYTPAGARGTAIVRFNLSVVAEALDDPARAVEARVVLNFWDWVQKHKREDNE